jgi:type VI secretion system protein
LPEYFGLLESIAGRSALNSGEGPPETPFAAVRQFLTLLFNTRQGTLALMPDFGLPDLTEIYRGYPDSLVGLALSMRKTIEKYEPRLRSVSVDVLSASETSFKAEFEISGVLDIPAVEAEEVRFRTIVSQNGQTQVGV